jgi:hypothetical protein
MITIEIYWNDLTETAQKRIQDILGLDEDDDNNWNFIPITTFEIEEDK